jgi:hypothetical protein
MGHSGSGVTETAGQEEAIDSSAALGGTLASAFLASASAGSFDALGVSKHAFPGRGKILGLSLEIGLVRQPSVFAAIVITALYFPTRYRCAAFCASARFGDKRAMRSYIALASSRRPA